MLSEQELKIVRNCKQWGFGAYLAWAWAVYPKLSRDINKEKYPDKKELVQINERMDQKRIAFDETYLHLLPRESVNPLQVEQEAWKLLSSLVKSQVDSFGKYIESYQPSTVISDQLLTQINNGWSLLQDWHIISRSYGAKLEEVWDEVKADEQKVRDLITRLS